MLDELTGYFYCNDGRVIILQEAGAKLLSVLIANKNRIVPREKLIKDIWHERYNKKTYRKLNVLVWRMNKRIAGTATIQGKVGIGYRIRSE